MSDNIPLSAYDRDPTAEYDYEFRALVMHLFMDDLGIQQINKYFFLGNLPERLKDNPEEVRSEILTYVKHEGLFDEWTEKPRLLRRILEEIGRTDLSLKVKKLVDTLKYAGFPQAQESTVQPCSNDSNHPTQETQISTIEEGDTVEQGSGIDSESSTISTQSEDSKSTITELEAQNLEHENVELRPRLSSNSSNRSSGYFSHRGSEPRLSRVSIPELVAEESESNDDSSLNSMERSRSEEVDEGVIMNVNCTGDLHDTRPLQNNGEIDIVKFAPPMSNEAPQTSTMSDVDLLEPMPRPRCYQLSRSQTFIYSKIYSKSNVDDSLNKSQSLPCSSRLVQSVMTPSFNTLHTSASTSASSSCSSSLDSDDSPNEGHDSRPTTPPPKPKPYPVVSQVTISGLMTMKVKNMLKSIEKNDQTPMTSDEFPSPNGYGGPRYEMRFHPSNFSGKYASLYVAVAKSYLRKKAKSKQHNIIEIPAMEITVTLSHINESAKGSESRKIKSVTLHTEKKEIDSQSSLSWTAQVASFPQLVSHEELKLYELGGRSFVVCVNMSA